MVHRRPDFIEKVYADHCRVMDTVRIAIGVWLIENHS